MDERWQEIERLYHAALEREKSARPAFLAQACAGDSGLRHRVEFLLAQDEQAGSFLETPAIEVAAEALATEKRSSGPLKPVLEPGTMIAHYRLTGKIGQGGMGEVYRARDTKLQRDVALKILPQAMALDVERMVRFEREAQVLASLNHPNIAAIYGLEESNGIRALVMELVEGETLGERLAPKQPLTRPASRDTLSPQAGRGEKFQDLQPSPSGRGRPAGPGEGSPLAADDALPIARQIAEALEYAHEHGVIHRDLKPANVKITREGAVKVLDFGLAKLAGGTSVPPVEAHGQDARAPADSMTEAGIILGTAAYMSPEQAKGQQVDRRCDIWAFGCVLYEMLSGRKAFDGETLSDLLAAVITKEPDRTALPPNTPSAIQHLIRRCLQKDLRRRLQAIGEARIAIEEVLTVNGGEGFVPALIGTMPEQPEGTPLRASGTYATISTSYLVAALARRHKKTLAGGLGTLVVAAVILVYLLMPPLPPPRLSGYIQLTHDGVPKELIGTDGSRLYLDEFAGGTTSIIVQVSVAGGDTSLIRAPSPRMQVLDVSPDGSDLLLADLPGQSIEGPLWASPILGGPSHRLADAIGHGGAWSPDRRKLVYGWGNELYLANGDGTESRKIATLPGPVYTITPNGPQPPASTWSPDGRLIRFTVANPRTQVDSIWQVSADGTELHQLLLGSDPTVTQCCGRWTPDGNYFVFAANGQIWARRETGSLLHKVSSAPVQLTSGTVIYSDPLPDKNGRKLYARAGFPRGELQRYDTKSRQFAPYLSGISASSLNFSRDKQWMAYVTYPEGSLWLSKADGSQRAQLTFPPVFAALPRWSPDGKHIAFMGQFPNQPWQIYQVSVEGGLPRQMTDGSRNCADETWSPDGTSLIFGTAPWAAEQGASGVYELNLKTRKMTMLPDSDGLFSPRWSPDGRYVVALTSDDRKMMLYDVTVRKWTELTALAQQGWQEWSDDGQTVSFWGTNTQGEPGIYRVRISSRKVEEIVSLQNFHEAPGILGGWVGLGPDRSPLLVKDTGTQEVVAMDWIAP